MFSRQKKLQQLVFEITPPVCQRIRRWQIALTQRILGYKLEQDGRAQVVRLTTPNTIGMVTVLPEPGTVEMFAGEMGGSYTYRFRVGTSQQSLIVSCNLQKSFLFPETLPPLVVTIPTTVAIRRGTAPEKYLALRPYVAAEPDLEFVSELGATFFIDGLPLERLQRTRWNEKQLTDFEYTFTPITTGCHIVARDVAKSVELELSQGLRF